MTKAHINLTVDYQVLEEAKTLNANMSGLFNDFLTGWINKEKADANSINVNLEKLKLKRLTKEMVNLQIEITNTSELIKTHEYSQLKKKEEQLKLEAETAEKANKCISCGTLQSPKFHKFSKGIVCNNCFHTATNFDQWM